MTYCVDFVVLLPTPLAEFLSLSFMLYLTIFLDLLFMSLNPYGIKILTHTYTGGGIIKAFQNGDTMILSIQQWLKVLFVHVYPTLLFCLLSSAKAACALNP